MNQPDDDREPTNDNGGDAAQPGGESDGGLSERLMFRALEGFVSRYIPALNGRHDPCQSLDMHEVDPRVRYAIHSTLIAACERMARICRSDIEPAGGLPMDAIPSVPRLEPSEN